jgi:hypothetical protein
MAQFRLSVWKTQTLYDCRDYIVSTATIEAAARTLMDAQDAADDVPGPQITVRIAGVTRIPHRGSAGDVFADDVRPLDPREIIDGDSSIVETDEDGKKLRAIDPGDEVDHAGEAVSCEARVADRTLGADGPATSNDRILVADLLSIADRMRVLVVEDRIEDGFGLIRTETSTPVEVVILHDGTDRGLREAEIHERLFRLVPALVGLVDETLKVWGPQFDASSGSDSYISGAELVDRFTDWRRRVRQVLDEQLAIGAAGASRSAPSATSLGETS